MHTTKGEKEREGDTLKWQFDTPRDIRIYGGFFHRAYMAGVHTYYIRIKKEKSRFLAWLMFFFLFYHHIYALTRVNLYRKMRIFSRFFFRWLYTVAFFIGLLISRSDLWLKLKLFNTAI